MRGSPSPWEHEQVSSQIPSIGTRSLQPQSWNILENVGGSYNFLEFLQIYVDDLNLSYNLGGMEVGGIEGGK